MTKHSVIKLLTLSVAIFSMSACNTQSSTKTNTQSSSETSSTTPSRPDNIEVESVNRIAWLTGERAVTNTYTDWALGGTDLGIPFYDEETDKMFIAFGDSYSGEATKGRIRMDNWRNNLIGVSSDYDLSDGLAFDSFLAKGERPFAKEIVPGNKHDGTEVAKIPTGGIFVNGTAYMFYMSVRLWGSNGSWDCSYGGCVKSVDKGETWTFCPDIYWVGLSDSTTNTLIKEMCGTSPGKTELDARYGNHFMQIFPVDGKDGYIYMYGITGGRFDGTKLMRVPTEKIEQFDEYEYFLGRTGDNAIWEKGRSGLQKLANNNDSYVINDMCGEMSVMYNAYLQKWITVYEQSNKWMVYRTSDTLYGPWSDATIIVKQDRFPIMYGGFMHEKYNQEGGKTMYFFMSHWNDYNVSVMQLKFK